MIEESRKQYQQLTEFLKTPDSLIYHRGSLIDECEYVSELGRVARNKRDLANKYYRDGKASLLQRKVDHYFEYIIIKLKEPVEPIINEWEY